MRIALVSDCYLPRLGGIELQVHDLAGQLIRAGHPVTVFTVTDGPPAAGDVPVVRLPALGGVPLPAATDRLRRALDKFDVVHAHTSLVSPLAWRAARLAPAAVITAAFVAQSNDAVAARADSTGTSIRPAGPRSARWWPAYCVDRCRTGRSAYCTTASIPRTGEPPGLAGIR